MTDYTALDMEIMDIDWYAVDQSGYIAHFMSGVYGKLPQFIQRDRQRNEWLHEFFSNSLPEMCGAVLLCTDSDIVLSSEIYTKFLESCKHVSRCGLYCYDSSNGEQHTQAYHLVCRPEIPLHISMLPPDAAQQLSTMRLANAEYSSGDIIII